MAGNYAKELHWVANEKYGAKPEEISERDVERILIGEPVDYVIGWKPFLNCVIDLSQKPLIPRVETEYWTEQFLIAQRDKVNGKRKIRILDMFSGSGCIGIAILKNLPHAYVDFVDYDPNCIKQIKINLKKNNIASSRVRVIKSNIFQNIHGYYDAIVANPPYVPGKNKNKLPQSVLNFEPHIAVFGGNDGLTYIRSFLRDARSHLNSRGEIWMEFDTKEKSAIAALAKKFGYEKCNFQKDQYGKIRYIILVQ